LKSLLQVTVANRTFQNPLREVILEAHTDGGIRHFTRKLNESLHHFDTGENMVDVRNTLKNPNFQSIPGFVAKGVMELSATGSCLSHTTRKSFSFESEMRPTIAMTRKRRRSTSNSLQPTQVAWLTLVPSGEKLSKMKLLRSFDKALLADMNVKTIASVFVKVKHLEKFDTFLLAEKLQLPEQSFPFVFLFLRRHGNCHNLVTMSFTTGNRHIVLHVEEPFLPRFDSCDNFLELGRRKIGGNLKLHSEESVSLFLRHGSEVKSFRSPGVIPYSVPRV
jgi:hypothetical protein